MTTANSKDREQQLKDQALKYHIGGNKEVTFGNGQPGKLEVIPTKPLDTSRDLSLAYSPGVGYPCLEIQKDPDNAYKYTSKGNLVAVISNGTAVLGLGKLGALASKPVMEGKSALFNKFANISAIDVLVDSVDKEEFINIVSKIGETYGGINLEDIASPDCFEIEQRLIDALSIPVFHDDQHGTAIISTAALINFADITKRKIEDIKIVVNGCGAAGISCIKLFQHIGVKNIIVCDQKGVIHKGRKDLNNIKAEFAINDTNILNLSDALKGADMFLGLSVKDVLKKEMIMEMTPNPAIFAMANPDPEIRPEIAMEARPDAIIATGRSDYPNQINNVMCFPFIFRGALDVRARKINIEMKMAAVKAIAELARQSVPARVAKAYSGMKLEYGREYIIPTPFDTRLLIEVSSAVAQAAVDSGVAKIKEFSVVDYKRNLTKNLSPISYFIDNIINNVSIDHAKNTRVLFSDGEEIEVIKAACLSLEYGYIPVLVGKEDVIISKMKNALLYESMYNKIEIINAAKINTDDLAKYIDFLYEKMCRNGWTKRMCARFVKTDRYVFSSCLLAFDYINVMISSANIDRTWINNIHNTVAFGISVILGNHGKSIFVLDTAINKFLTPEQMSCFAIKASKYVKSIGETPRVAFVSASNFGKDYDLDEENANAIRTTLNILNKANVDFEYDGEMSIDIALNKELLDNYQFSHLTDTANILIFPELKTAKFAIKMIAQFGRGTSVFGPIICGLNKKMQLIKLEDDSEKILNLLLMSTIV